MVGVLVPLLAAVVLVWSTTGREQNLDRVSVAVVNEDTVITGPQPMAAGRALAAALTQPTTSGPTSTGRSPTARTPRRGCAPATTTRC